MRADIKLLIFDCDGVLIDSEVISAKMLRETVRRYGVEIPFEYIIQNYVGRSYPKVLADVQSQFSIQLPDDFETEYRTHLLAAFEEQLLAIPNVETVLQSLNVPFAVATSSSPPRVKQSLRKVGLADYFGAHVYTASLVERGKPAPDLFLYVAEKMGVAPENILVIEDSRAGVQAGLAAGMHVVRFVGGQHLYGVSEAAGAHGVIADFAQFFQLFPELRARSL